MVLIRRKELHKLTAFFMPFATSELTESKLSMRRQAVAIQPAVSANGTNKSVFGHPVAGDLDEESFASPLTDQPGAAFLRSLRL